MPGLQDPSEFIDAMNMARHVEGGSFVHIYPPPHAGGLESISGQSFRGSGTSTAHILYVLRAGEISKLHRLDSIEMIHHYAGGPVTIVELISDQLPRVTTLGKEFKLGQVPFHAVPENTWFGMYASNEYCLLGCTTVPAFDYQHFSVGTKDQLDDLFPLACDYIEFMT